MVEGYTACTRVPIAYSTAAVAGVQTGTWMGWGRVGKRGHPNPGQWGWRGGCEGHLRALGTKREHCTRREIRLVI